MPAPASNTAYGLARPTKPATGAGNPKMPLPTMLLTASATMLQRPMARTNSGCELCGGACVIALLYHNARALAPITGVCSALQLRDPPRVQSHRGALRHRQAPGSLSRRQAVARPLRSRGSATRGVARGHRGARTGPVALARVAAAPQPCWQAAAG